MGKDFITALTAKLEKNKEIKQIHISSGSL